MTDIRLYSASRGNGRPQEEGKSRRSPPPPPLKSSPKFPFYVWDLFSI